MTARIALNYHPPRSGPRPLNPMQDMGGVADLLELVFNQELDAGGRQMIREARALSRAGPLVYLLAPWSAAGNALSPGFVWEEDGQIVGNVTIIQSRKRPNNWQIANVAVNPTYRQRGIATELMQTSIAYIRRHGGHLVSLQVKQSNPAIALYKRLSFSALGAVTRWQSAGRLKLYDIRTIGRTLRPARRGDWLAIWQLFSSVPLAAQGWPDPLGRDDLAPNFLRELGRFFNSESLQRWVIDSQAGAGLDGYVELMQQPRMPHRVTIRAHQRQTGYIEGDLLYHVLQFIPNLEFVSIVIDHPASDIATEARLREAGFHAQRTLLLMQLDI